jgi:hypothetical protein
VPPFLTFPLDGVSTPVVLPSGKESTVPLGNVLDGVQSRVEGCGEEKNLLPQSGFDPLFLGRPAHSPSLYRMSYPNSALYVVSLQKCCRWTNAGTTKCRIHVFYLVWWWDLRQIHCNHRAVVFRTVKYMKQLAKINSNAKKKGKVVPVLN